MKQGLLVLEKLRSGNSVNRVGEGSGVPPNLFVTPCSLRVGVAGTSLGSKLAPTAIWLRGMLVQNHRLIPAPTLTTSPPALGALIDSMPLQSLIAEKGPGTGHLVDLEPCLVSG